MKRHTRTLTLLGLGSVLLVGAAQAQPSSSMSPGSSSPSSSSGPPPGSMPSSSMSSSSGSPSGPPPGVMSSSQTTTTTTQQSGDAFGAEPLPAEDNASTLPETGGEPWMMFFAGSLLVAGSLVMRRRLS